MRKKFTTKSKLRISKKSIAAWKLLQPSPPGGGDPQRAGHRPQDVQSQVSKVEDVQSQVSQVEDVQSQVKLRK